MQDKTQMVKNLLAMQETKIQSLGQEDPLEKEIATHSSILSWRIPWLEEPGLQGILFEDISKALNVGLSQSLNGVEPVPTPLEKIIRA